MIHAYNFAKEELGYQYVARKKRHFHRNLLRKAFVKYLHMNQSDNSNQGVKYVQS